MAPFAAHFRPHRLTMCTWMSQERARNKALGVKEMEGLFREHLVALGASAISDFKALLNEAP